MVEQTPCPVCTLYLHPGMSLTDHLETHPKEQVIKALVSLISNSPTSSCRSTSVVSSLLQNSSQSNESIFQAPVTQLTRRGYTPNLHEPQNDIGIMNSREARSGFITPSQRNLMIVNRQSTMVYQSDNPNQSIIGQQISLSPSPLQLFGVSSHNQAKFLTPPPAYGTAVSQLRSQSNQSIYGRQNQSQLETTSYLSDQSALDYTLKNASPRHSGSPKQQATSPKHNMLLPRRSTSPKCVSCSPRSAPSPSVLRYADSPVTAHYVERDNGDFIVHETPRHVVECVEKDDGEFSVIEKVIHSPPSVVQFHDEHEINSENHDIDLENHNVNSENHDINPEIHNMNLENHEINSENHEIDEIEIDETKHEILNVNEDVKEKDEREDHQGSKQKKTVSGLTVISNVKLNPNESLDLMENIMASNNSEVEAIWSGIIEKSEKENSKTKLDGSEKDKEKMKTRMERESSETGECSYEEQFKINKNRPITRSLAKIQSESSKSARTSGSQVSSSATASTVAATSVIRLASTPVPTPSAIETATKTMQKTDNAQPSNKIVSGKNQPLIFKPNYSRETTKRPFKKIPKKLVVKFKNTPAGNAESTNDISKPGESSSSTTESVKNSETSSILKTEVSMFSDQSAEDTLEESRMEIEKPDSCVESQMNTSVLTEGEVKLLSDNETVLTKLEEGVVKLEPPPIPAIQPMIVYESSLSEEPRCESVNIVPSTSTEAQPTANKYEELSKLIGNGWDNTKPDPNIINQISEVATISSMETITTPTICPDDNNTSMSSIQITEVNTIEESQRNDSSSTVITLSSFPSTSNFSKPSTSSSALQEQTEPQNSTPNYDYPFSLLYANNMDRNRLSPIYPTDLWKSYNGPVFQTQPDFQDNDKENSYIDLDDLKKANSSDAVPFVEALNIRTDEKMPAKGEISEQESNGDVENSWSQPLGGEQPYRFFNHLEFNQNYVARESWSDEGFICPQTTVEDIKPKPILVPSSEETIETQNVEMTKKRKPRKITKTITRKKIFTCDHCSNTFPKLKDRNLHLIVQHEYKRVNRRLVRQPPSATITSATIPSATITSASITSEQQQQQLLPQQQKEEEVKPQQLKQSAQTLIENAEDVKPDTKVGIVSMLGTSLLPRTKHDSIRAEAYRMLMNFNFGVLKQKRNVDIDETMFESKTFCCFTCSMNFVSVKQFDEHLIDHPAECFTCGRKFTRWSYFSLHLKRHLGWKDFECTTCGKKFVIKSALVEHTRTHSGISPLKCKHCGKNFKRYSNLTQHKRLCHGFRLKKKKEYVCYCGEVLPSKARFIWHREIHDTKPKCCPHCRDRFIHKNSLRRHIRLVHSEKFDYDQPAECPICNQIYAKNSLKGHMSTHSMDTQHECAICNKSFSTKWNLKIHSWVHANRTAKPFKCDLCVKAFVREIDYKNHINAHKQIKPFTCEHCGCKFIRKYNYLRHTREHHGIKKFRCEMCGKQFHRHYYLIEHRRTHTGERPFLCTICGKSSTTKTNHNKHLKIHHSRDPFTSET